MVELKAVYPGIPLEPAQRFLLRFPPEVAPEVAPEVPPCKVPPKVPPEVPPEDSTRELNPPSQRFQVGSAGVAKRKRLCPAGVPGR